MPRKRANPQPAGPKPVPPRPASPQRKELPPTVSGRWLAIAAVLAIAAAAALAWLTLCLLFWQGSWQLLYHPSLAVTRTPASVGLAFDPVAFAATEAGEPRLKGWWIPAATGARYSRYTVLYLHGENGNLGDAVNALATLHAIGVNVLAFDYRGYGQSQFAHPSEARWREDADWALKYLTATRHVAAGTIILDGRDLGANLALQIASEHPELAGTVLESPLDSAVDAILSDPRARLVPAHLLVRDRFDTIRAAGALLIPSLWLMPPAPGTVAEQPNHPNGYDRITARKTLVWLPHKPKDSEASGNQDFAEAFRRWLDDLQGPTGAR